MLDEAAVRNIARDEIRTHLDPIKDTLTKLDVRTLRLWNDNGGPDGFFQMRMVEDDRRHAIVVKKQEAQAITLKKVDDFVDTYNLLQKQLLEQRERRDKQLAFWLPIIKWVGGGIGVAILAASTWLVHAAQVVWQDYLNSHPDVGLRTALSSTQSSDDAAAPLCGEVSQATDGRIGGSREHSIADLRPIE